jgi:hypothetical protein
MDTTMFWVALVPLVLALVALWSGWVRESIALRSAREMKQRLAYAEVRAATYKRILGLDKKSVDSQSDRYNSLLAKYNDLLVQHAELCRIVERNIARKLTEGGER